jgi:hypothetical protein
MSSRAASASAASGAASGVWAVPRSPPSGERSGLLLLRFAFHLVDCGWMLLFNRWWCCV